jgi:predicted nucleic acid-binding Zn ribbon protein
VDCPKCGTWNPDDKQQCWRCGELLPKPQPQKPKRRVNSLTWMWIVIAILAVLMIVQTCVALQGGLGR